MYIYLFITIKYEKNMNKTDSYYYAIQALKTLSDMEGIDIEVYLDIIKEIKKIEKKLKIFIKI